jgi:hypothetical protein
LGDVWGSKKLRTALAGNFKSAEINQPALIVSFIIKGKRDFNDEKIKA